MTENSGIGVSTLLLLLRLAFAAVLALFAGALFYFLRRNSDGSSNGG